MIHGKYYRQYKAVKETIVSLSKDSGNECLPWSNVPLSQQD